MQRVFLQPSTTEGSAIVNRSKPQHLRSILPIAAAVGLLLSPRIISACTIGCAMGNATPDGRPISWKNRDGSASRHYVMFKQIGTYGFMGIGPDDESAKMGVNEAGLALANATSSVFKTSGWDYSHHQMFKNYILSECANVSEVRQALIDTTTGAVTHWPTPISLMSAFSDAYGAASLFEIGGDIFYEYDPTNPDRLNHFPSQLVIRDNTTHENSDQSDDNAGGRYANALIQMQGSADDNGITMHDMFNRVSRAGHPGYESNSVANARTIAALISHGVLPGEDPRIVTMWVALGNPDYTTYVPVWVALGSDLSPRVASADYNDSISGCAEQLFDMRADATYNDYIKSLMTPMEDNVIDVVSAARAKWLESGFVLQEARRIHHEAAENAWHSLATMTQGTARALNQPPGIVAVHASIAGSTVAFGCDALDSDGEIATYAWDFGDGFSSAEPYPSHTYSIDGTYLVRCRVADNAGGRNSKWRYVTVPQGVAVADVTPPSLVAAFSQAGQAIIAVTFSERVASGNGANGAERVENYSVTGFGVSGALLDSFGRTVTLSLDGAVTACDDTTVMVRNVADRAETPNAISDDVVIGLTLRSGPTTAIASGATWRYFEGSSYPGDAWNGQGFDDSEWLVGPAGIGYGDDDDATVLSNMAGNFNTIYLRKDFLVAPGLTINQMDLDIDYDDGFVAFLNGTEVARRGVPRGQDHNTTAAIHEAGFAEAISLSQHSGLLVSGENILAVEVHNQLLTSSDLSFNSSLTLAGSCQSRVSQSSDPDPSPNVGCDSIAGEAPASCEQFAGPDSQRSGADNATAGDSYAAATSVLGCAAIGGNRLQGLLLLCVLTGCWCRRRKKVRGHSSTQCAQLAEQ